MAQQREEIEQLRVEAQEARGTSQDLAEQQQEIELRVQEWEAQRQREQDELTQARQELETERQSWEDQRQQAELALDERIRHLETNWQAPGLAKPEGDQSEPESVSDANDVNPDKTIPVDLTAVVGVEELHDETGTEGASKPHDTVQEQEAEVKRGLEKGDQQ